MDGDEVEKLARHEAQMWGGRAWVDEPPPAPGPGAYWPLRSDGEPDDEPDGGVVARARPPRVDFLGASALDATLAFRFRWPPDPARRDLILLLDFSAFAGDVVAASVWLLEYVEQRIHHDTSWFPRDVIPISKAVALVRAARQPNGRP